MKVPKIFHLQKLLGGASIVFIVVYLVFLSFYSVKWEKNEFSYNTTINGTNKTVIELHYSRTDAVPVRQFGENNFNHWGMEQVFFAIVGLIVFLAINRGFRESAMKTEEELKEIARKKLQTDQEIDEFKILKPYHLQYKQVDEGKPEPFRSYVYSSVKFNDSLGDEAGWWYLSYAFNPYTGNVTGIEKLHKVPDAQLKCPNCGSVPDLKIITPEGLKTYREKFKEK